MEDREKRREKEAFAAKRKQSDADVQAARIAVAKPESQETKNDGDDAVEINNEKEEVEKMEKVPKYKQMKEGETPEAFAKRLNTAEKTAATKARKKLERKLPEQQQAAGLGAVQDKDDNSPEAQQSPTQNNRKRKADDLPDPDLPAPSSKKTPVPPAKKQTLKRNEGETDKRYEARVRQAEKHAAFRQRLKEAKEQAAVTQRGNKPSQPVNNDLPKGPNNPSKDSPERKEYAAKNTPSSEVEKKG